MAADDKAAMAKAKAGVLRFEVGDETTDPDKRVSFYGDLYNFVELADRYSDPAGYGVREAGADLKRFVSEDLTIRNVWLGRDRTGKEYSNTHGIAINIPGRPGNLIEYYPSYTALAFEKASGWNRFMTYLGTISD
jgi:hypothetical protein